MTEKTILEKNSMLVREFDKYILEHPEFADCIPDDALVVIQLEGDEEFNAWAREAARIAGEGHHIAFVNVTEDIAVDGSLIQKELGFVPQYDLKAGWEETIREMKEKDSFKF